MRYKNVNTEIARYAREVIGAAIEVHKTLGPGSWNLFTKKRYVWN